MSAYDYASETERRIIRKLLKKALEAGYTVSVNDGEETTLVASSSLETILKAMATTGMDRLYINNDGKRIGTIELVYGNEEDVISDHSMDERIEKLVAFVY